MKKEHRKYERGQFIEKQLHPRFRNLQPKDDSFGEFDSDTNFGIQFDQQPEEEEKEQQLIGSISLRS